MGRYKDVILMALFIMVFVFVLIFFSFGFVKSNDEFRERINEPLTGMAASSTYVGYAQPVSGFVPVSDVIFSSGTTSRTLTFGAADDFIYRYAYVSINGSVWIRVSLTGASPIGAWFLDSATGSYSIPATSVSAGENSRNYVAVYSCKKITGGFDCNDRMWQIRNFRTIKTNTVSAPVLYCGDRICNNNENCSSCAGDCGVCTTQTGKGVLQFKSGFESNVYVSSDYKDIRGSDGMDWIADMDDNPKIRDFRLAFIGSAPQYGFAQIKTDPVNSQNRCLYMQINDDDPSTSGTSRAQCSWYFNTDSANEFKEGYIKYRVYWNADIRELEQYPDRITWFTIMELWEERNPSMDGDPAGHARWNIGFYKDAGVGQPLYWALNSEYMQPESITQTDIYPEKKNKQVPIPLGQWATLEFYFKRGQGANGHILMTIQPDGGQKQIVFDVYDYTEYPNTPTPFYAWNAWKLYTSDSRLDWMRARGKTIGAYYDDFEWWSSLP